MSALAIAENPRVHLGANNPPDEAEPTPFELARNAIDNLAMEARNWLDGAEIENQAQADCVGILKDSLRRSITEADAARVAENEPFDKGKAEVQERYAPLIADTKAKKGKAVLALAACNAALTKWLRKLDDERREAAAAAKAEADRIAKAAADAMRAADATDLTAREDAEALVTQARDAQIEAAQLTKARVHVAGGARATGLTSTFRAQLVDAREAARHFWTISPAAFDAVLQQLADAEVRSGKRAIPGFDVVEDRHVR